VLVLVVALGWFGYGTGGGSGHRGRLGCGRQLLVMVVAAG